MKRTLSDWVVENPKFNGILPLLETDTENPTENESELADDISLNAKPSISLSDSYIPPIIQCLTELALGTEEYAEACKAVGKNENTEFERKVAIAFRILGMEVEELGQGRGNNPDGIAIGESPTIGTWALLYDAKVRTGDYLLSTDEERKFKDYLGPVHNCQNLIMKVRKRYFGVIGSRFRERDLQKAKEIKASCPKCDGFVLLKCETILNFVEQKIKAPNSFDLERFRKVLETVDVV